MENENKNEEGEPRALVIRDFRAVMQAQKEEDERESAGKDGAALIRMAVEKGQPIEYLERLLALQERWEAAEERRRAAAAERAYTAAVAAFKAELGSPVVGHNAKVDFTSTKGRTHYTFANLAGVLEHITATLSRHGLTLSWEPAHSEDSKELVVKTILTHIEGHSKSVTLRGFPDESGNKNALQARQSTITYLERYGALSILGLTTAADDDDAGGGAKTAEGNATPESRPLPKPVADAVNGFERYYKIDLARLEKKIGKPVTAWKNAEVKLLGKDWETIHAAAADDDPERKAKRQAKAEELFPEEKTTQEAAGDDHQEQGENK